MSWIDSFRDILEELAHADLIPFIREEEQRETQDELRGKQLSLIFDGTTHIAEAMAIVIRYVSCDLRITVSCWCTVSDKICVWRGSTPEANHYSVN